MAWNVEDCGLLLDQIAGHDQRDPATSARVVRSYVETLGRQIKGVRLGIPRRQFEAEVRVSPAMASALEAAFAVFRDLGADLREIDLPPLADWKAAGTIIMLSEAYALHERRFRSRPDLYGELMRDLLSLGALIPAADYINAQKYRRTLVEKMRTSMADVDAVIGPTQAAEAPRLDLVEKWRGVTAPSFTLPYNLSGYPAISVCCGFSDAGLPLALQIATKPFQEQMLLQIARAYERATDWRRQRPTLPSEQSRS
jgi:Asp-tRNA(Asn)/Glu-tRNA(Gln) amidotransferase A subunit family amidase